MKKHYLSIYRPQKAKLIKLIIYIFISFGWKNAFKPLYFFNPFALSKTIKPLRRMGLRSVREYIKSLLNRENKMSRNKTEDND